MFTALNTSASESLYARSINPQWVKLLNTLRMNVRYRRCEGAVLHTEEGGRIVDFLSGYCVHNAGHNHPVIIQALKDELDRKGPGMLQSHVPELAGELASKLCERPVDAFLGCFLRVLEAKGWRRRSSWHARQRSVPRCCRQPRRSTG